MPRIGTFIPFFVFLLALILIPAGAQDNRTDYERYFAYFPDTTYSLILHRDNLALQIAKTSREFPALLEAGFNTYLWPFSAQEYDLVYGGIVNNVKRMESLNALILKKNSESLAKTGKPISHEEQREIIRRKTTMIVDSISVFGCADLQMLIETGVKQGTLQATGKQIGKIPVFVYRPLHAPASVHAWCCSPQPDILLAAGSEEFLGTMVHSGDGTVPALLDGEYGGDIPNYFGDGQVWWVQPSNMAVDRMIEKNAEQEIPEKYRKQREESLKRVPLATIGQQIFSDDQMIFRTESIFRDESAAETYMKMIANMKPYPAQAQQASDTIPAEIRESFSKRSIQEAFKREKNRVVQENAMTLGDLEERQRLRDKYKEYYESLRKKGYEWIFGVDQEKK